ncbi:MAG: hypothetical protein IPO08_22450 [Xanthomonadales bacterium]|nr:hypothetical protein [Xanthomonadales bacterium]
MGYKTMLDNCPPDDAEQLHDILSMMAVAIDKINAMYPSTAVVADDDQDGE